MIEDNFFKQKVKEQYETTIAVCEEIESHMEDYLNDDELDEYGGDVYEAYLECGRGEAESQFCQEFIDKFDPDVLLKQDPLEKQRDTFTEEIRNGDYLTDWGF